MCTVARIHLPSSRIREIEKDHQKRDSFYFGGWDEEADRKERRAKRRVRRTGSVQGAK